MNEQEYFSELKKQVLQVIRRHPEINNWYLNFPWLTGSLGNPFVGIWFMAENPSKRRLERVAKRNPSEISTESQWSESTGDKLFRQMLVKHGFKQGKEFSLGGWSCYITNIIKQPDYADDWGAKTDKEKKGYC